MKKLDDILDRLRQERGFLEQEYHVASVGVFGSVARGDFGPSSDVDIVVEFNAPIGLAFVDLAEHLEEVLGERVDLVSRKAIKPRYWDIIQPEVRYA